MKLSKRTRLRLGDSEMAALKGMLATDSCATKNIQLNTGINPRTIKRIAERGWAERPVAERMRDFLKMKMATA
ncbi:MAG: hypothetical protein QM642_02005 [Edaphocola sp.]